jgi:hypothetical protein
MNLTSRRLTQGLRMFVRVCVASFALIALPLVASAQATTLTPEVTPEMVAKAQLDGKTAAMNAGGWFGRSVVIGAVTGLIGTAVTVGVAGGSGVELPPEQKLSIARQPLLVQQTFEKSYADAVRSKRKSSAWKGGLLGTAAFVVLLISSSGSGQ